MSTTKTWATSMSAIAETFRKWLRKQPEIENDLTPRQRAKKQQTPDEREVRLRFTYWVEDALITIRLNVRRKPTAQENAELIAMALEMVRMAEVRGVADLLVVLYRQMYPQPPQIVYKTASSAPPPRGIPAHYALLHLVPSAPLEVCEAVYRKLATKAHPDAGGDADTMVRLNAAIEQIRKEKEMA